MKSHRDHTTDHSCQTCSVRQSVMHHTETLVNEFTELLDEVKIVKRTLLKANHLFAGLFASRDRIGAFLAQFLCSDCNFLAGEVIQRQVRDNFPLAVVGGHRETED
jgi:hypothetical protein